MESIIPLLQVSIYVIIGIMIALVLLYIYLMRPAKIKEEKEPELIESDNPEEATKKKDQDYGKFHGELNRESIYEFMEFDEVVDNMIVRKKGSQYVMVIQCNGVNYDLMSEQEKIGVEEGFVQFLNTLRFPIQLYIQSRTLNLRDIIDDYKQRVDNLANDIEKVDIKIAQAQAKNNRALKEKLEFEKRRKINVLEYGIDITDYVEKLSANKNVLQQRTYVVVSYYTAEMGSGMDKYSKEEIDNMCFSELYTRCQNIASALASSGIASKILDSEELAELLYVAYNRDESELLTFSKALDSQYDALYSSGKDVIQKKQEKLDQEINIAAIDIATDSILKADKRKQLEDLQKMQDIALKNEKIQERALDLLGAYEEQLNPRVYELAQEEVKNHEALKVEEPKKEEKVEEAPKTEAPKKKIIRRRKTEE